jgi:hypothetical protein
MAQIFHRSANTLARVTLIGGALAVAAAVWFAMAYIRSTYVTRRDEVISQPVPFSHDHHVGQIGIDCRYCHTGVERAGFAGIPPTATCMNCHSQIWADSPMLEPVRASFRENRPLQWNRVHDLADFVYFDHSVHVQRGVGCADCHGRVDQMPLMRRVNTLQMEWCLDCHRHPERGVRPLDEVFSMTWGRPDDGGALGRKLVAERRIKSLTNCSTCHR